MGRLLLVSRLAVRDLRRRPAEAALLLVAIVGATATLTLGLVLHGVVSEPYRNTREATNGPDVIASSDGGRASELAALEALADAPGVTGHSGPYPVTWAKLVAHGRTATAQAEGRDAAPAPVDQPKVIEGSWVGEKDAVVVEAAFADALGVDAGDSITLNGRSFRVAGVAVTAASSPYPEVSCLTFCIADTGLVWLARADARRLATRRLAHVLNLKLADPAAAPAFAERRNPKRTGVSCAPGSPCSSKPLPPILMPWQDIREATASLVDNQRRALLTGGWLLVLLAIASVAVLVGSRMADQIRRVGLLKAVGGTPSLVAAVLLAEYVAVAVLAAAVGLVIGWLAAPLVTDPSAGLLGSSGSPSLGVSTVGLVTAAALGVAVAATCVPAVRAARTSTVLALADSARSPRRTAWLISLSARLPIALLLGLRVAARRPRRVLLATASIAVTVSGIVAALAAHADLNVDQRATSVLDSSRIDRLNEVLLVITLTLVALAAVNAIFVAWASALDARHSSALARALGATPQQVSAGLSTAQMVPALAGALLGIPGGIALISAVDPDATPLPPLWQLLAVVPSTVVIVAALTAIPARIVTRRPVTDTLRSELA
jgi:putative ABC transport system permease protein